MNLTTFGYENFYKSPNQKSFLEHENKVSFLETLSILLGCINTFTLSDGTIPDVLKINMNQDFLFIGDAKESETPGNTNTQKKLLGYLDWLNVFCKRTGNSGVFAVCYNKWNSPESWERFLETYALKTKFGFYEIQTDEFSNIAVVTTLKLARGRSDI